MAYISYFIEVSRAKSKENLALSLNKLMANSDWEVQDLSKKYILIECMDKRIVSVSRQSEHMHLYSGSREEILPEDVDSIPKLLELRSIVDG